MKADPCPHNLIAFPPCQGPVIATYPHRPVATHFLKVQGGMILVVPPQPVISYRQSLHFGRQCFQAFSEARFGRGIHRAGRLAGPSFLSPVQQRTGPSCQTQRPPRSAGPTLRHAGRRSSAPIRGTPAGAVGQWPSRFSAGYSSELNRLIEIRVSTSITGAVPFGTEYFNSQWAEIRLTQFFKGASGKKEITLTALVVFLSSVPVKEIL